MIPHPTEAPDYLRRRVAAALGLAPLALLLPGKGAADTPGVDLQLVLAVDTSGSVNDRRFQLQKEGYVKAFRDPRILKAIRSGPAQAIAVTAYQWTGPTMQAGVLPWTVIRDTATIEAFATAFERQPRELYGGGTSISGAIDYAMTLLARSPFRSGRQVIDISGDGANNRGRPAAVARDEAIGHGVTINGLPILELERDLDEFYRSNVIGGPNAFMIPAATFDEFAEAILKKLVLEIAGLPSRALRVGALP